jgi:hypothetical protein
LIADAKVDRENRKMEKDARKAAKRATKETNRRRKATNSLIARIPLIVIAFAGLLYIGAIGYGSIGQDKRLDMAEISLGMAMCLLLTLVIYPQAFDRLSIIKLPGGVEVSLSQLEKKQEEQQTSLDAFSGILANLLTLPEKYHMRALDRGDTLYTGQEALRQELLKLKRYGLIDEVPGQKIGDIFDRNIIDLAKFVRLSKPGKRFLLNLDRIEAQ